MPFRNMTVDGASWRVTLSGHVTANDLDELGLVFTHGDGASREWRVTRLSPFGVRSGEHVLATLSDAQLHTLWHQSQPSATSPDMHYARSAR